MTQEQGLNHGQGDEEKDQGKTKGQGKEQERQE